ncbi:MAG: D-alanine--D-alanine ligase [Candidatus Aldehydirespiratoraceae bacterium]|jgi:D-alanine--D-alanine ligase
MGPDGTVAIMTGTGMQPTDSGVTRQKGERIDLIVLFGGESAEHDVSCTTAAHVLAAADPTRYRITPVGISTDGRWAIADAAVAALEAGPDQLPGKLDPSGSAVSPTVLLSSAAAETSTTVVMPLLHGPMGEDGTVQGLLELANLPYVGAGVLGSAVAMDKAMAKQVLTAAGIPQARYRAFAEHEVTPGLPAELAGDLGLPVFVKPANMGSSVGVSKAATVEEIRDAIVLALTYDEMIVVEEAIVGKEIEVAVLGNLDPQAATPGEIVPGDDFYSYDDKYISDRSFAVIPAPIGDDALAAAKELAIATFRALRCEGLSRVDFFWEDPNDPNGRGRGFLCNEVNTMPGFTPISMFPKMWISDGVTYPEIIDRLVELALERHGRRRRNTKH